jgi:hypothetical protein
MHRVARCADGAVTPLSPTPRRPSTWHSGYRRRGGFPAVAGRRVRQRLTPTTRRRSRRPRREGVLPRMHCPNPVGATRYVARRAAGPGMGDDVRGCLCMAQRPSGHARFAGPQGRRVRQRLTPTERGSNLTVVPMCPTGDRLYRRVGVPRGIARRTGRRGNLRGMHQPRRRSRRCRAQHPTREWSARQERRSGSA